MSNVSPSTTPAPNNNVETIEKLPIARFWGVTELRQWGGFWFERRTLGPAMTFRSSFEARDDDVLLTSAMKTGTAWLKSISFSIMKGDANYEDMLTAETPHSLVPTIETMSFSTKPAPMPVGLYDASAPHLLHTHVPYSLLPDSVKTSSCKIVHITRNPKDTIISMWHFINSIMGMAGVGHQYPLEKAVDCFCSGLYLYGSFFDHVLEYWLESKRRPGKILFLRYEELKSDPKGQVSGIADFLGRPFRDEGEVDAIIGRCSLERVKNLEVNRNGSFASHVPNSSYFRKGEVGDWKSYLTPEMEERIDQMIRIKLEPFGLFL